MDQATLADLVEYATRAPSGHNTQPWRFAIDGNAITIRPDYGRRLPVVDPDGHALFMSLGCAVENLVIAAAFYGYKASVTLLLGDGSRDAMRVDLSSTAPVSPADDPDIARLARAIRKRQTTRGPFQPRAIPASVLERLERTGNTGTITTRLITGNDRERLADPIRSAAQAQFRDPAFRAELLQWIRFSRSEVKRQRDGLAANVMGLPFVPHWLGKALFTVATLGRHEPARLAREAVSSPALMAFTVDADTPSAWVEAGRCFQRVALQATADGLKHAHVNMPCEVPAFSQRLADIIGCDGRPVLLIRFGYGEPMPYSERRPLARVLSAPGYLNRETDEADWDGKEAAD